MVLVSKKNHDEFFKKIGRNIAKYRVAQGYTQESFANKIGISYSHFTQIEAPNIKGDGSLFSLSYFITRKANSFLSNNR